MKISSLLCFSLICICLEARPDESSHTTEIESKSVENTSPTAELTNENVNPSDNIERDGKITETTALPIIQPELKSDNNDYESDNASDSGITEAKDQSNDRYESDEQIIIKTSKKTETTENNKEEDRDGKSKENTEVRRTEDDDSIENTEERSDESNEEETSELDLLTLLGDTRRMISYSTAKPVDVETRPGDKADQILESRAAFGLKPMIPLLPLPIPTMLPTAGLPKPHTLATSNPYLNPIKLQNYPNAATQLKRLPFGFYDRKPLPGIPVFPKPDFPRPVLPLIEDFAVEPYGNAYPFVSSTPAPLDIFPQDVFPKNLYSKLMQASEHPIPYQPGLFNPFGNTGYPNTNYFLGAKNLKLRPHSLKRNL